MAPDRQRRRRTIAAAACVAAGLAAGGTIGPGVSGAQNAGASATAKVVIKGKSTYRFSPRTLTVKRGQGVKWSWNSNAPHNVDFRRLHKKSKTGDRGSFSLHFAKRGSFGYVCTVHGFTGKIVVK
jgi:plastocyanin